MVSLAALRQSGRESAVHARPNLKVIDQKSLRSRAVRRGIYFMACIAVVAGLFGVALVQAQLVQEQQKLDELRSRLDDAQAERALLTQRVDIASSPEAIVTRATDLGMVRAADPIYFPAIRGVER